MEHQQEYDSGERNQVDSLDAVLHHRGHDALKREGMAYRINTRSALWIIELAVLVGLLAWWVAT